MGFNNDGVEATVRRLEKRRYKGICGVNIGKNFDTPLENAASDYLKCLHAVYATADYITVNISSPNTPGLRDLQHESSLEKLLGELANARESLAGQHSKRVPLVVKIAPDLDEPGIDSICRVLEKSGFDGVCATNTTITRPETLRSKHAPEKGGLSGRPVHEPSKKVIRALRARLGADFPIIGVGGIESTDTGRATFAAGADLVQVYTGLDLSGPAPGLSAHRGIERSARRRRAIPKTPVRPEQQPRRPAGSGTGAATSTDARGMLHRDRSAASAVLAD